jgi:hypothetical protein
LSRYNKRQNQYYQNKIFRMDCKKVYSLLRQKNTNVKNVPTKEETGNFSKERFNTKRSLLDQKPMPIKFQNGLEPSI